MSKKSKKILIAVLSVLLAATIGILLLLIFGQNTDNDNVNNSLEQLVPEGTKRINLSEVDGDVEISDGGNYLLVGTTENSINITSKDQTTLYLQDVQVNSQKSAILSSSEKLAVTPLEGTENVIINSGEGENSPLISTDGDFEIAGSGVIILKNSSPENECIKAKRFLMTPGMQVSYIDCEIDNLETVKP